MNSRTDMDDRVRYFFDNIAIKDEDRPRAERAIFSKGIEKHIIILDRLKPWSAGDKVEYEFIASTYRYDKRLRVVLFKYISYLEEYYRSLLLDRYRFEWSSLPLIRDFGDELDKCADMSVALEEIHFSTLIRQIAKIKDRFGDRFVFPGTSHIKANIDALIELRNGVMHNKLLVLYHGFKECYLDESPLSKGSTLKDNIINLISFLPEEVREKCKEEILFCSVERNNENKTKWVLPPHIVISL